jgi:hypothetical protein
MITILARSPYFITVNESLQTAAKVELFIWNKGDSEPVSPTYVLEKPIVSAMQRELIFNISPYLLEYIDYENYSVFSPYPGAVEEDASKWCLVRIKTYYKTAASEEWEALSDLQDLAAVNGFSFYTEGGNYQLYSQEWLDNLNVIPLSNANIKRYVNQYSNVNLAAIDYFNVLINHDGVGETYVEYTYIPGGIIPDIKELLPLLDDTDAAGIYNFKIPYIYSEASPIQFIEANSTIEIITDLTTDTMPIYSVEQICEPKYTPVRCTFQNRYGGWDAIWFFKAQSGQYDINNSTYQLAKNIPYSTMVGQTNQFNYNIKESIRVNTGWVDENYSDYILELMSSQSIYLDFVPVTIKSKNLQKKTYIKDKNINYEIEFEYDFNLFNDQI